MPSRRQLSIFLEEKGYLNQPGKKLAKGTYIQNVHIVSARQALDVDRDSLYRNALIAYSGVYRMVQSKNHSWALVHSYYSIFYFYQVLLALNDKSLCYDYGSPFSIKLAAGAQFQKASGNTHRSILQLFNEEFDADAEICSDIGGVKVGNWFEEMRNMVNYKTVPQADPLIDYGLQEYNNDDDLRKKISVYLSDLDVYAYTPDHSYVAYPMLLIRRIMQSYCNKGLVNRYLQNSIFTRYLSENIRDKRGPLTMVLELINGVGV